jgi:phosphatidate cytidylyltransferase
MDFYLQRFGMRSLPSSFLPRLLSTVILWGAILAAYALRSEVAFAILISVPALGALWEYFALLKEGGISHHRGMGMTAAVILITLNFLLLRSTNGLFQWSIFPCEYAVTAFFVMALFLREYGRNNPGRATAEAITFTLFGVVYIPWLFLFMAKLLYLTPHDEHGFLTGQYLVLFVIAVTKFTDVGAFLCGSLLGRTPFFPNISPKKTWEGIIGGVALGILVGVGVFHFFGQHLPAFSLGLVCSLSLVLAIAGVAGDLAESLLKRSVHTKDSGHALPGIGGGLDLIDSLLFTLPLFYFILLFILNP